MHAIVHLRYGTPDVLELQEIERPTPRAGEVLVRVHAANASIGDHHVVAGMPYAIRLSPYGGFPRPKNRVPGVGLAGRVVALGSGVTELRVGDEVFGEAGAGAFAEFAAVAAERLAPKPANLSFEEAAASTWGLTALQGLRDVGGLRAGQRVLINGASGGVGTWAVQIAKAMGGVVTAVCSDRNVEMVRALGAEEVIDYAASDFTAGGARFDLFLDLVSNRSISECRRVVVPGGVYVSSSGRGNDWVGPLGRILALMVTSLFSNRRLRSFMAKPNRTDLLALKELVEAGKARPVIERCYPLAEVGAALAHVGAGRSRGQTVIGVTRP